jgi:integrase
MRRAVINRSAVLAARLPGPSPADGVAVLDRENVPDGLPIYLDDDGTMIGTRRLNDYLLAAHRVGRVQLASVRDAHSYHLARCVRFIRARRAVAAAASQGIPVTGWIAEHGEPRIDLTDITREDLRAYHDHRRKTVSAQSWNTEMNSIAGFFTHALQRGWIDHDPRPLWGRHRRDTLRDRVATHRQIKFLTEPQLRTFLQHGLRGDPPVDPEVAPAYPDRDYVYGLTLVSTGLRRAEAAHLLSAQIPAPHAFPCGGVIEFVVTGKGERPRTVYITRELAEQVELFRLGERATLITRAQPTLRRRRRASRLELVEVRDRGPGGVQVLIDGRWVRVERLGTATRQRLVRRLPDGSLDPLALFPGRAGMPFTDHWSDLFDDADARLRSLDSPDVPPAHLKVTPHVLRHTFAVRMLSALMREGRERNANPYQLLANPILTVQQLLGHVSPATTQIYLYAAERFTEELPAALRGHIAAALFAPEQAE